MEINAIYPSWDGEVNALGIGAPTIFVRTQGCPHRCYLKTKGILCDTPEALKRNPAKEMSIEDVLLDCINIRTTSGINKITLTGGDPLWADGFEGHRELIALFELFEINKFIVTVETSGTISIKQYRDFDNVHWVLDYKLRSCGVPEKTVQRTFDNFHLLNDKDFVKFVIDDWDDFNEALKIVNAFKNRPFKWAMGLFWGSKLTNIQLFDSMVQAGICGEVVLNIQTHKWVMMKQDLTVDIPKLL